VLAAILLLMPKTRMLGATISLALLFNILLINVSFDISVKLFTVVLIFVNILLLAPEIPAIWRFFLHKKTSEPSPSIKSVGLIKSIPVRVSVITFFICLIILETLLPYFSGQHFIADKKNDPYLHGAYAIISIENDYLHHIPLKRLFIHRDGYLIFQDKEDRMEDYKLTIDTVQKIFLLTDYNLKSLTLKYVPTPEGINLQFFYQGSEYWIKTKELPWHELPALIDSFHWMDR